MMLAVFDFPEQSTGDDAGAVPALVVDHLRGYRTRAGQAPAAGSP